MLSVFGPRMIVKVIHPGEAYRLLLRPAPNAFGLFDSNTADWMEVS